MKAVSSFAVHQIVFSEIESRPSDGRGTSPGKPLCKLVLLILLHFDGDPVSIKGLSEIVGCCDRSIWLAIAALEKQGFVKRHASGLGRRGGRAGNSYTINMEAIRRLRLVPMMDAALKARVCA